MLRNRKVNPNLYSILCSDSLLRAIVLKRTNQYKKRIITILDTIIEILYLVIKYELKIFPNEKSSFWGNEIAMHAIIS